MPKQAVKLFFLVFLAFTTPATASPPIRLGGPEVIKLDWNTRALQAVDVNGDGRMDLVVINNDRARIDFLLQRQPGGPLRPPLRPAASNRWEPELEDARFEKDSLTTGVTMFDLIVADVNGDGRPDLIYTGDPDPLTVRLQQPDGSWGDKKVIDIPAPMQWVSSLKVADLNGDGRNDIVLLTQKELVIINQNKRGELEAPERYPMATENCYGLEVVDVNGDGRPDLVYLAPDVRDALRVRLQTGAGGFGPELAYPLEAARSTLQILPGEKGKGPVFAFIQNATGQLELFAFEPDKAGGGALRPRVYSPRPAGGTAASYAFGDFNGDGITDLAVSDPDGAQVFIYLRQRDGEFAAPLRFPSLADGRSIAAADWDGDGRAQLFVASPKERTLAVAAFTRDGRLGYPQPIPLKGRPLAIAAGSVLGGNRAELVCVKEDAGKRFVEILARKGGRTEVVRTIELTGLKTDPKAVRILDANRDGLADLAIFTPFEPMRLLVQKPSGVFSEATAAAGFRQGLVDNLDSPALTLADVDADGRRELLVAGTGFARALRLAPGGELSVVDQFNARDSTAEIAAALLLPPAWPRHGGAVLLLDRKTESFQLLRRDARGVYQFSENIPAGKIDLVGAELRTGPDGKSPELFFLGKDRFWWLPSNRQDFVARPLLVYTTDLKEINYGDVIAGDLNGDGVPELVAVDPDKNFIEVLSRDERGEWQSKLHFKVFETDAHYQGRKGSPQEPRETIIADVTGDGKPDLILLVHDRILVYPQE